MMFSKATFVNRVVHYCVIEMHAWIFNELLADSIVN